MAASSSLPTQMGPCGVTVGLAGAEADGLGAVGAGQLWTGLWSADPVSLLGLT